MRRLLLFTLLLAGLPAFGQTTTYTGTIRDLTGAAVTSGRISFTLSAPGVSNISGTGSFVSTTVSCLINASGAPVSAVDGTSPCVVTSNTALTPTGTSYKICLQPYNVTPGSCLNAFALGGSVDISTLVPTPATQPSYGLATTTGANTWSAPQTWTGANTSTGGVTFTGQNAFTLYQLNGDLYLDGSKYTTLAAAITALPSGGTLHITAGTFTVSSTLVLPSNLNIECSPNYQTIIQASAGLNATMLSTSGSHIKISGCVLDGNRGSNSNLFPLMTLTAASNVKLEDNQFQNNQSRLLLISSGNSHVTVSGNEFKNFGQAIPASVGSEGIAIAPASGGAGNAHIQVKDNYVHDGNLGIAIFPSDIAANISTDIDISHNRVLRNANDGILTFSVNAQGGPILRLRIIGNESACNGWPANGTGWDSTNCPPGLLQTGSTSSSSGVGIDLNSAVTQDATVVGNDTHHNFFEGIEDTPQITTNVNCTNVANSVCTATGSTHTDPFNTAWKPGQGILINSTPYTIQSVASTTVLTLNQNTGALANAVAIGAGFSHSTFSGNIAEYNGNGAPMGQGNGFACICSGDTWSNNIAWFNNSYGFVDNIASYVSHVGDKAFNNNRGGGSGAAFYSQAGLSNQYIGISADDYRVSIVQTWGLVFDAKTTGGFGLSSSLNGASGSGLAAVQNLGTGNKFSDGVNLVAPVVVGNNTASMVSGSSIGTGPTAPACFVADGGQCTSSSGLIQLTTGTGATAGPLVVLSWAATPKAARCTVTGSSTAGSALLGAYPSLQSTTGLTISAANVPAASTTFLFAYTCGN